jgi:IclR family transcriptional regulator, acetate operon repressor
MRTTEPKEIKVKTVERTLDLLGVLAEQNTPIPLTRVSQIAKLSISTTYRLLSTLCRSGFVERDKISAHYRLGLKAFLIGNAALQNIELRPIALPHLNQLALNLGESIFLAIISNQNVIYSDCIRTAGPIQVGIQTGMPIPACQTSSGKVLIANLSLHEQQVLAEFFLSNHLLTDKQKFLEELTSIRLQGFCSGMSGVGETIREISVPIFNYLRMCAGTISVFRMVNGAVLTEVEENILTLVRKTSIDISRAMGYPYPVIKKDT